MPRDLKTIVLKALEKDRDRRYQSAYGLAQDIRRYRRGELIVARSPSLVYQLTVLARRHKPLIGAAVGVVLALAIGAIVSSTQYLRAKEAGRWAEAEILRRDVLSRCEVSLGPDHPKTLAAKLALAKHLHWCDDLAEADQLAEEVYLDLVRTQGETDPATLEAREDLAAILSSAGDEIAAEQHQRAVLEQRLRAEGDDDEATFSTRGQLANMLLKRGEVEECAALYESIPAPTDFEVTRWFQGDTIPDLDKPTLLIFWEVWCPYSLRQLPKEEQRVKDVRREGLQVIGFTRTEGVEDRVAQFLGEKGITFPVAQISNDQWHPTYGYGVPSAALLYDGHVVWAGHPADLDDRALAALVRD